MDGKHGYEEKRRHRQTNQGNESSEQDCETSDEFTKNGKPCHEVRRGNSDPVKP
jgi:hypothetical protein